MTIYYVYAYLREKELTPYYIGKGKGRRAWEQHQYIPVPKDKSRVILIEQNLTEIGALAIERRLIKWYGRKDNGTGILQNRTDGGDGNNGYRHTEETKLLLSLQQKGKSKPESMRSKLREVALSRPEMSVETRQKISDANRKRTHSAETKAKMSSVRKGRNGIPMSEETKQKLRDYAKNKPPQSPETLAKISATMKAKWEKKKAAKAALDQSTSVD